VRRVPLSTDLTEEMNQILADAAKVAEETQELREAIDKRQLPWAAQKALSDDLRRRLVEIDLRNESDWKSATRLTALPTGNIMGWNLNLETSSVRKTAPWARGSRRLCSSRPQKVDSRIETLNEKISWYCITNGAYCFQAFTGSPRLAHFGTRVRRSARSIARPHATPWLPGKIPQSNFATPGV
jgi:hypothetical protein